MKLFQQLLVAPAALGLLAPMAANAAELNINGVSNYSASSEEVKSISQFSDVYPTDWAYQALTNLAERHGCVAGSPNGSMTRYEAAALLNSCLGNVAQVNEEERRLINEFGPELAVIKGRIDGIEAGAGAFEAGMFSTTTKLNGKTEFVMGGVDRDNATDTATTLNYSTRFDLKTSFTGKDLLYTRIKAGNFDNSSFASKNYGAYLGATHKSADALEVDKIWYTFPLGDNIRTWVGPAIENDHMLASKPSIYKSILKDFGKGGAAGAYGVSTGGGFGVAWTQSVDDSSAPRFAISSNYVSSGASSASDGKGMLTDNQSKWLNKIEYGSKRWQVSLGIARDMCDSVDGTESCKGWTSYYGTEKGKAAGTGNATSYSARAYWKPEDAGAVPSVQIGYDIRQIDDDGASGSVEEQTGWMVGLTWKDAFIDGNKLGMAYGQRMHASEIVGGTTDPAEDNYLWEVYYSHKISDSVSVTPAIFGGEDTYNGASDGSDDILGAIVKTTFKF